MQVRHLLCVVLPAWTAVVAAGCSCSTANERMSQQPAKHERPTTKLDTPADNSRCHVCHMNFEDEELAAVHALAGLGCEKCHGQSDAHCDDEENITPPDTMFPSRAINPSCLHCHPELAGEEHDSFLKGKLKEKYCTDCHGEHRMAHRTVRWDKKTGKLIE